MTTVFISSTHIDLSEHRRAVINALLRAEYKPLAMEYMGSRSGDAEKVSIDMVNEADVFVGIYAHRYGYRPDDDKSVTELEYLAAKHRQTPLERLIYLVDKNYQYPLIEQHRETDPEAIALLQGFKRRLEKNEVRSLFTTPEDLAAKVIADLARWGKKQVAAPHPSGGTIVQKVERGFIAGGNVTISGTTVFGDVKGDAKTAREEEDEGDDES